MSRSVALSRREQLSYARKDLEKKQKQQHQEWRRVEKELERKMTALREEEEEIVREEAQKRAEERKRQIEEECVAALKREIKELKATAALRRSDFTSNPRDSAQTFTLQPYVEVPCIEPGAPKKGEKRKAKENETGNPKAKRSRQVPPGSETEEEDRVPHPRACGTRRNPCGNCIRRGRRCLPPPSEQSSKTRCRNCVTGHIVCKPAILQDYKYLRSSKRTLPSGYLDPYDASPSQSTNSSGIEEVVCDIEDQLVGLLRDIRKVKGFVRSN